MAAILSLAPCAKGERYMMPYAMWLDSCRLHTTVSIISHGRVPIQHFEWTLWCNDFRSLENIFKVPFKIFWDSTLNFKRLSYVIYDMIWYDTIRYMIWYDTIRYMIWYDTIRYDTIWHHMTSHHIAVTYKFEQGYLLQMDSYLWVFHGKSYHPRTTWSPENIFSSHSRKFTKMLSYVW